MFRISIMFNLIKTKTREGYFVDFKFIMLIN